MRFFPSRLPYLLLPAVCLAACLFAAGARGQSIVVLVNDEPVTSFDVAQRVRWQALTGGNFGERMKSLLTGDAVNQRFRQMLIASNPHSQAEAQQAAERIKKELIEDAKRRVLSEGGSTRKAAIDALIEDKLKLQAAKKFEIKITDKEVEENLQQRAGGEGKDEKKAKLEEFYQRFEKDGINRKTIKEVIRAQLAWRDTIRRVYGPRIQSAMAAIVDPAPAASEGDLQFDVRVLRLAVKDANDQKLIGERMLEAENLKNKFTTCSQLPKEATLVADATVKAVEKVKLTYFPKDVQPLIEKANEGQMTPPVLIGNTVESYAVCRKGFSAKPNAQAAAPKPDPRQQEYERFARSYLQELKQKAAIDYRASE